MNKQLLSLLSLIVLVALGIWAFTALNNENNDSDDSTTTEVVETTDKNSDELGASMENEEANPFAAIVGAKQGSATLLQNFLTFPESTMVTNPDQTFTLDATGLDLASLQNPALEITPGVYPKAGVKTGGTIVSNGNSINLQLSSLTPDFYTEDESGTKTSLDAATQQKIAAGIQAAGIIIPTIDAASPVTVPVTVEANEDGTFTIQSTDQSAILAKFDSKVQ
jgi:hypothetical protein